ncbi:MAG: PglZ domain-containing protein [Methanosarcinales archaeon]
MQIISAIEEYIEKKKLSNIRFLFLVDKYKILQDLNTFSSSDLKYEIIHYQNNLQLREKLEKYRDVDASEDLKYFCIILASKPNQYLGDFIARGYVETITPVGLLETSTPEYNWSDCFNSLSKDLFWSIREKLIKYRLNLPEDIKDPNIFRDIFLSACLDIDLTKEFNLASAIVLWGTKDISEEYLKEKVIEKIKREVPLFGNIISENSENSFIKFLVMTCIAHDLTKNPETFLTKVIPEEYNLYINKIPLSEVLDTGLELIKLNLSKSINQIKEIESALNKDQKIDYPDCIFKGKNRIEIANILQKSQMVRYSEKILIAGLKIYLQKLIYEFRNNITNKEVLIKESKEIVKSLKEQHILYLAKKENYEFNSKSNASLFGIDLLDLVSKTLNLFAILESLEPRDNWNYIYKDISKFDITLEKIRNFNKKCLLLSDTDVAYINNTANDLRRKYNLEFAAFIKNNWINWISDFKVKTEDRPYLVSDFIGKIFKPCYEQYAGDEPVFIIIFNAMRLDTWKELIKPCMELQFFDFIKNRDGGDCKLVYSMLPSITKYSRYSLFFSSRNLQFESDTKFYTADKYYSENFESNLLKKALKNNGIEFDNEVYFLTIGDHNAKKEINNLIESVAKIKCLTFNFLEDLHNYDGNLLDFYEQKRLNYGDIIKYLFNRIPINSLLFIISDHGFIKYGEELQIVQDIIEGYSRYFITSEKIDERDKIVFFEGESLKLNNANYIYGFAVDNYVFNISGDKKETYGHGGISMQEMLVPCVIAIKTKKKSTTISRASKLLDF